MTKRYYWMRLKDDFFDSKRIKKLRSISGGDTFVVIYLKMQLLAIKNEGVIEYTGLEEDFASELALDLDESVDNVRFTLNYLQQVGLIETNDEINFFLPYAAENCGSEGASAERMRKHRKNAKLSQCDKDVTLMLQNSDGEKEIEKEKDIEIEIDRRARAKESICLHLSNDEWDLLDNEFEDLLELIDEADKRVWGRKEQTPIEFPYEYIRNIALQLNWLKKRGPII